MGYAPQGGGGGATKLSQLTIDCNKDWGGHRITNLKELVTGMNIGDIVAQDPVTGVLVKISPGPIGYELFTKGANHLPAYDTY
jgi:hypothetical protein